MLLFRDNVIVEKFNILALEKFPQNQKCYWAKYRCFFEFSFTIWFPQYFLLTWYTNFVLVAQLLPILMQITYANAYSLELSTLNSLKDYLSNRQLKTKVDSKFSLKKKLYMGYYRILFSVQFCSTSCVTCS